MASRLASSRLPLLAATLFLAALPSAAQTPQITSLSPLSPVDGQVMAIKGTNLYLPGSPATDTQVEFLQGTGAPALYGTIIPEASSPTSLYVRVPAGLYINAVRVVRNGNLISNQVAFTSTSYPAPPALRQVLAHAGSACSGTPNPTPITQVYPGQWIALAADGIDIYGGTANFNVLGAPSASVVYYGCSSLGQTYGTAALVRVPANLGSTGTVRVSVSSSLPSPYYTTPFSNEIALTLIAPPVLPSITSIQPNPAALSQSVTLFGSRLMVPGGGTPAVEFWAPNSEGPEHGTVLLNASNPNALHIILPPYGFSGGEVVEVRLYNEYGLTTSPFQFAATPVAPIIRNIYGFSTPPNPNNLCSGTLSLTPLTQILPGQVIAIAASGISQTNNTAFFSAGAANAISVASPCSIADTSIGLAAVVTVPASVSGCNINVAVQTMVDQVESAPIASPPSSPVSRPLFVVSASSITLTSSLNPSNYGQAVNFSSQVGSILGCAAPTGTVTFLDNGVSIGVAPLNANGQASLSVSNLTWATHPITARYSGDTRHAVSTSSAVQQVVRPPVITITGVCPANVVAGTFVSIPLTASGGTGAYQYNLAGPTWLSVRPVAGGAIVEGTPPTYGTFPFTVTMTDAAGISPATFQCNLQVAPRPLVLTGVCPTNVVMSSLFRIPLTASGGTGAYQYSLAGPPWLSVRPVTGGAVVEGTPPTYGSFPFTVTMTDSAGLAPVVYQCALQVLPLPLTLTGSCPASSTAGVLLRIPLTAAGGTGAYQYSYTGPSWLSLKPGLTSSTMVLEGTPPAVGTFPISVTLTETAAAPATFQCVVKVDAPLSISGACPAAPATLSQPYSQSITVSGGSGQYEFFLNGPPWLSLGAASGTATGGSFQFQLTGTPTAAGSFPISLQVRDVIGSSVVYSSCSIVVASPVLPITSGCPASPIPVDVPYSFSLSASGGSSPYNWSVSSGSLPPGLGLTGNIIAGTPQGPPGASSFTIRVDSGVASGQIDCSMEVLPPPVKPLLLTGACPAQPVISGTDLSWGYNASGGTPPYQFLFAPPVPDWLSLSSAGSAATVTGTAPLSGVYPVAVEVRDSKGLSTISSCNVTVTKPTCPPLELKTANGCPASAVLVGSAYSLDVSAAGGKAPYAWNLAGPAWLSLLQSGAASARVSGTPTAAGSVSYTVSLADACESPTATLSCSLTASPVPVPQVTFSTGPVTDPLKPVVTELRLSAPSPVLMDAELVLTFTASAFGMTDNPRVQFLDPAATNGGRRLKVKIPAGTTVVQMPVQADTVAGTIRIELVFMGSDPQNLLVKPYPASEQIVPRIAPVITSLNLENATSGGFDIVIAGYSTPRDMTTVTVTFSPRPGKTIDEPSTISIAIADIFRNYYSSSASMTGGSTFTGLRLPVQVEGAQDAIASVSVVLSNSSGASKAEVKSR
jgi:hypothetical protein